MTLTALEEQWIDEVFDDGTGYLDNSEVNMEPQVERGVISSLIKKGIIETQDSRGDFEEADLIACQEYANLFE